MGVNFASNSLEFALIKKKKIQQIQAKEYESFLNLSLQKSLCIVGTDSKEKNEFLKKNFERIDEVFEKYVELISFRRPDNDKNKSSQKAKEQDQRPIISVKDFFEKEVLKTMGSEGKVFTSNDIISSLRNIHSKPE